MLGDIVRLTPRQSYVCTVRTIENNENNENNGNNGRGVYADREVRAADQSEIIQWAEYVFVHRA